MNSEERDIINGIFQRLEQASGQPRDADAERFIAEKLRSQPYAPYAMAQLIYVQEEAIKSLNQQLEQARSQAQSQPSGGGFLSSIFGGGQRSEPQRPAGQPWGQQGGYGGPQQGYGQPGGYGSAPQGGPWGGQPQQPARGGGGFLATALPMAAGAAGGMLLGSALSNAFAGGHSALGSAAAAGLGGGGETIVENNDFGGGGDQDLGSALGGSDGGFQDASFGGDSGGDFGGDLGDGGDDDWA
ncbi:MAG: DUF2076 domain-containing protein [Methylorubrum populi]